jgi:hypothetical protein
MIASDPLGDEVSLTGTDGGITVNGASETPTSGMFAHIAAGGGWKTTFSLINISATEASTRLQFWDDNGAPLVLSLAGSGQAPGLSTGASISLTIPPNGLVEVEAGTSPSSSTQVGWAELQAPTGVLGWATFGTQLPTGQQAEAVVQLEARTPTSFILPYDNTNNFSTGVAVASPAGASSASILIVARDSEGKHLLTDMLQLPARGHSSFSLPDKYPSLIGLKGTLELQNLKASGFTVLGLRFSPSGSITSIPVAPKY